MSQADIRQELESFGVDVKSAVVLEKLERLCVQKGSTAEEIVEEWMAYSAQNSSCPLDIHHVEKFNTSLMSKKAQHTPRHRSRTQPSSSSTKLFSKNELSTFLNISEEDDDTDNIMAAYGTPDVKNKQFSSQKREMKSPSTPVSKVRHLPFSQASPSGTLDQSPSSMQVDTPAYKYGNRHNRGKVVTSSNDHLFSRWQSPTHHVPVRLYDEKNALTSPQKFMYQKISDRVTALINRIEDLGKDMLEHNGLEELAESSSLACPSVERGVYLGMVTCEGEGRLNPQSCILEGVDSFRSNCRRGVSARLELPDTLPPCSLFPGQVIAVDGILNHSKILNAIKIYDEGVYLPPPDRHTDKIGGLSAVVAAGPFTTPDSLDMIPLNDLLRVVAEEKPDLLVLIGPFIDITHPDIVSHKMKKTFAEFLNEQILSVALSLKRTKTSLVVVPSQQDALHKWKVYPQPPYMQEKSQGVLFVSDPSTLLVNGVCIGVSSTDILRHLSSRSMFRGPTSDRMSRLAGHVLQQQCYYPLYPTHKQDEGAATADVNFDVLLAYDNGYACLPARPDLLILPSDLKPFIKVVDGCTVLNPGHLTRKASGGTYAKFVVSPQADKIDIAGDIGTQIKQI